MLVNPFSCLPEAAVPAVEKNVALAQGKPRSLEQAQTVTKPVLFGTVTPMEGGHNSSRARSSPKEPPEKQTLVVVTSLSAAQAMQTNKVEIVASTHRRSTKFTTMTTTHTDAVDAVAPLIIAVLGADSLVNTVAEAVVEIHPRRPVVVFPQ
ncbi:hypothetical protein BDP81DRAFT_412336 [Colletotrichum phormii]|uniref:Uncharacterized protein n=1 Tax=Colletotrichum phormii TaxID=359342 RepID=A0AAJ0EKJ1_9PEZI|nr:uncharacterized protein BDP81DRAFT_412336 [Colletotrichum phormii]KAK1655261.1 hypothetical protein BDP81DRAFT_412336 [Colletotrichum phormii]